MGNLFPFVVSSVALHLCAFFMAAVLYPSNQRIAGLSEGDPDSVFVTVVSESDSTPTAMAPASVDSPASAEAHTKQKKEQQDPVPPIAAKEMETPAQAMTSQEETEAPPPEKPVETVHKDASTRELESAPSAPHAASDAYRRRSAMGSELRDFRALMLAAIRQATYYPQEALKEKQHGEVVVSFSLNKDGALEQVDIVRPSGFPYLDKAAQEIIRKAAVAFPRPPSWMSAQDLNFKVPIMFKEKRTRDVSHASSSKQ